MMNSISITQQNPSRLKQQQQQQQQQHQQQQKGTTKEQAIRNDNSNNATVQVASTATAAADSFISVARNEGINSQTSASLYPSIGQPYSTESSNFGPIYHHHHHHHHNHLAHGGYGNPYDKIKVSSHMRQTNPYTSYQTFYGSAHQMVRSNNYIDLVPR